MSYARFIVECLLEGHFKSKTDDDFVILINRLAGQCGFGLPEKRGDGVVLIYFQARPAGDIPTVVQRARLYGWFPSLIGISGAAYHEAYSEAALKKLGGFPCWVTFEARYDQVDTKGIQTNHVYHVTSTDKVEKILKLGISPRAGNKITTHPDRVYVCYTLGDAAELADDFKPYHDNGSTVIRIERNQLGEIYRDPNFPGKGGYVLGNIKPEALSVHREDQPGYAPAP